MVYPRRLIERQKKGFYISPEQQLQIDAYRLRERLRQRDIRNRRLSRASEHDDDDDDDDEPERSPDPAVKDLQQSPATSVGSNDTDNDDHDDHDDDHGSYQHTSIHPTDDAPGTDNGCADNTRIAHIYPIQSSHSLSTLSTAGDEYFHSNPNPDLFQLLASTSSSFPTTRSGHQIYTTSAVYASSAPAMSYFSNTDSSVADLLATGLPLSCSSLSSLASTTHSISQTPQDESDPEPDYTVGRPPSASAPYYTPHSDDYSSSLFTSTPASSLLSVSTTPELDFLDALLSPDKFADYGGSSFFPLSPPDLARHRDRRFSYDGDSFFV
ncbi:hypothetical protein V1517DRAFT_254368 [Lipomyces orientalis]|uniref:Uncharacterized protein n=1 Tax=Lipomyces orientalis TaxID=1233043 RepID=A0ACC3TW84_9ASCO